jgi:hypothetical protein
LVIKNQWNRNQPLPVTALVLELDKQQPLTIPLADESLTDESFELPVEELGVYSKCQKSKTIPDAACRT